MYLQVLGVNHKSASIEIRERISFSAKKIFPALIALKECDDIKEGLILSTCNRVEIYAALDTAHNGFGPIKKFLYDFHQVDEDFLKNHTYTLEGIDAIRHLFRVVSSLDSMVVGETQVLGQVKDAYSKAREAFCCGRALTKVFEEALRVGKRVRTETRIGKGTVSISSSAIVLAKNIFGSLKDKKVLIIGAGKIAELAVENLYTKGVSSVLVANRTYEKAKELARAFGGIAITFDQIDRYLEDTDILISSTSAPHYILTYERLAEMMRLRGNRALCLIDLGLPRNISPEVSELEQVHLYNLDDLTGVCDASIKERLLEVRKVEQIIEKHLAQVKNELAQSPIDSVPEYTATK